MGRKLYVGNLGFEVTTQELRSAFETIGACESADVVTDRETGRSRGFGFVEMTSNGDAEKAIQELNGRELQGRAIRVSEAQSREGGGGGRGRSGGGGGRGRW
jgi:RNA recognition motif-containing protein